MDRTYFNFLLKIYNKCDSDNFQCAEDMQYALEEIRDIIKDKYPQVVEKIPTMILHCPADGAEVEYDEVLDVFKCAECEWSGLYHETVKPYEINIKKTQ